MGHGIMHDVTQGFEANHAAKMAKEAGVMTEAEYLGRRAAAVTFLDEPEPGPAFLSLTLQNGTELCVRAASIEGVWEETQDQTSRHLLPYRNEITPAMRTTQVTTRDNGFTVRESVDEVMGLLEAALDIQVYCTTNDIDEEEN